MSRTTAAGFHRRLAGWLPRLRQPRQPIYILVFTVESSGVATSMLTLANALAAEDCPVEVISLFRVEGEPLMALDPRIRLTYLEDCRGTDANPRQQPPIRASQDPGRSVVDRELDAQPSVLIPDQAGRGLVATSALTDEKLKRYVGSLDRGVLISNRPSLHQAAARWLPESVTLVAVEHSTFVQRKQAVRELYRDNADRFDAVVTLTEADRRDWDEELGGGTRIVVIPNSAPPFGQATSPLTSRTIVAAGWLVHRKGFDRLIDAFQPVADDHPDWQLHIYGSGGAERRLNNKIRKLGLQGRVILKGHDPTFRDDHLPKASIYGFTSRLDSFGMVILEAMACGVPVIAFDCPQGPRHIITHDHDGIVVPDDDIESYSKHLQALMESEALRRRLGSNALETVKAYSTDTITQRWIDLFTTVTRNGRYRPTTRL